MASDSSENEQHAAGRAVRRAAGYLALPAVVLLCLIGYWKALGPDRLPYVDFSAYERSTRSESSSRLPLEGGSGSLRFAVATMWSVQSTFALYRRLVHRIACDIGRQEAFVLRPSYAELRHALEEGQVDVALVCTGPYVHMLPRETARLLVQPEFESGLPYRSVMVVQRDSSATGLADLAGKDVSFSDRESFTGCLVPCLSVVDLGRDPAAFFGKVVYTGSHDQSIEAVDRGLVDAAALHSIVWDSAVRNEPALAQRLKEIWWSDTYGPPPVVVPCAGDSELQGALRDAFLALHTDLEGSEILRELGIRRFVSARPADYQTAVDVYERLQKATESIP